MSSAVIALLGVDVSISASRYSGSMDSAMALMKKINSTGGAKLSPTVRAHKFFFVVCYVVGGY